ncbi:MULTISPECIES: hemerythrin domain-containing protein [unclassified Rhizobacter]|uniref:hemerythrin domain-containing protein n=1 Tax=unclassified Rhizobacter TaxID=2640088 RepID=UPI0006FAF761|nr:MULTISPECIES: hemerythrin domain-containing protein [unclassified Rhizobacter]KQU67278.1 hemerythrin [Rhizobacter sp. Root29]KQW14578.1 hemerythrin [Rhizobacter sp. Root1238]KRB23933.1 hemerythrin [Rhizobacter sp. Root16D2]
MQHAAVRVILEEHSAMSAMLRSISLLLADHRRRGSLPDFGVLRAMLFYVDEFPERLHHAKESELLFPLLRQRTTEGDAVLDRLDREHADGERAIRVLEHELLGFEMMADTVQLSVRRDRFEQAMLRYIDFYLAHIRAEEAEVLPLAERVLTADDWAALDSAFCANRDPLTGHQPDDHYRHVFKKILWALPPPLGIGPAICDNHGHGHRPPGGR